MENLYRSRVKGRKLKQTSVFRIDLNKIEGDGDFPCPSCGVIISPDDDSERVYKIIDMETFEDGSLKNLSLLCKKCNSIIILEGFETLRLIDG